MTAGTITPSDASPFAQAVDAWRRAGWLGTLPLPAREKDEPPSLYTGYKGEWPHDDAIDAWRGWPDANICGRLPDTVVGLDVDAYKAEGAASWAELHDACGLLPPTWRIRNRDDDDLSGTYLFRLAEPTILVGGVPGIELIQHHHRYQVLPPSVHPEGRVYRLYGPDGEQIDQPPRIEELPLLPPAWVARLSRAASAGDIPRRARATDAWAPSVTKALGEYLAELRSGSSRHDVATRASLAFLRYEDQEYPGATEALEIFGETFIASIGDRSSPGEARAEWQRMIDGGRKVVASTPSEISKWNLPAAWAGVTDLTDRDDPPSRTGTSGSRNLTIAPTLPDEIWRARPALAHIRQSARHFLVAPDATLLGVLARVVAYTHPFLGLPPMPRYGSLNMMINLVGASGTGKGASTERAQSLVPMPSDLALVEVPAGSGEGMVRSFFTKQPIEGGDGKATEWRQTRQSAIYRIDEGRFLKALAERSGQTTVDTMLQGFSGEQLGGNYTDPDKRGIVVRPHTYRMVVITGIQPENAEFLLKDHVSGFPQRMLWAACIDPSAPPLEQRPADPGALVWTPPDYREAETVMLSAGGVGVEQRHALALAPDIADEILERRHAISTGQVVPDTFDSHHDLLQLKVAGAFGLLDKRVDISGEDWELAAMIVETSGRVRSWVEQRIREQLERDARHDTARTKRRAAAAEEGRAEQESIERKAVAMARWARTQTSVTRSDLRHRLKSSEREDLFDRVFGLALSREWLRAVENEARFEATAAPDDSEAWPL